MGKADYRPRCSCSFLLGSKLLGGRGLQRCDPVSPPKTTGLEYVGGGGQLTGTKHPPAFSPGTK